VVSYRPTTWDRRRRSSGKASGNERMRTITNRDAPCMRSLFQGARSAGGGILARRCLAARRPPDCEISRSVM
jgi:hypothetical protein